MADPFAAVENPSPDTATATGSLGGSPDFWRNLMNFGAADLVAANARTPQGFLEYGPGWQGALGAGILGAENQQRQNASLNSQINLQQAQAGLTGAQAGLTRLQVPFQMMKLQMLQNALNSNPFAGQSGGPMGGGQPTPLATGISSVESGGNPNAVNQQGYTGQFQIGTAAMSDAGIYTPAKGEDLSKNAWSGTVNIPGFQPMNQQQFLANPAAQKAAFQSVTSNLLKRAGSMGLNAYVGKTVGGVPMTANSLLAGMYFAGPTGMQQFLQTNGNYNPVDSNGRSLTAYMARFAAAAGGTQGQASQPAQGASGAAMGQPGQLPPVLQNLWASAQQLRARAYQLQWVNPQAAQTLNAEAAAREALVTNALRPQSARPGGIVTNWLLGGPTRAGTTTHLVDPRTGTEIPAQEYGPVETPFGRVPGQIFPIPISPSPGASGGAAASGGSGGAGGGGAGTSTTGSAASSGNGLVMGLSPQQEAFLQHRGEGLADQFQQIDESAATAMQSNYLFDSMRRDSQSWVMGKFADWKMNAWGYIQAFADNFGIKAGAISPSVADFQAFQKSAGMVLREAVRSTSSRAAVQEYNMIGETLPNPENTAEAFNQIADQWQGLNDYAIAKQRFAKGYQGDPGDFNVAVNSSLNPTSFLLNRMMQSQQGQSDLTRMAAAMSRTKAGQMMLKRIRNQYAWALANGYFTGLPGEQTTASTAPSSMAAAGR